METLSVSLQSSLQKVWSHSQKRTDLPSLDRKRAEKSAQSRDKTDQLDLARQQVKRIVAAASKGRGEPFHLSRLSLAELGMLEEVVYFEYLTLKKEYDSRFPSEKAGHIFQYYRNLHQALQELRQDFLHFLNNAWHDQAVRNYVRRVIVEIKHQECASEVFFNCEFEMLGDRLTVDCPQLLSAMGEELDLIKAISRFHKISILNRIYFFKSLDRVLKNIFYV